MGTAAFAYIGYGLATLGPGLGIGLMVGKTGMVEALGLIGFVLPLIVK